MRSGPGWWGTRPLVVGLTGLALLAFGADSVPDPEAINAPAHQEAAKLQEDLHDARDQAEVSAILRRAEEALAQDGKHANLQSLAPRNELGSDPRWIDKVGEAYYQARSGGSNPRAVLAGRIAFYGGLILVFAAGVLLYLHTPDGASKAW